MRCVKKSINFLLALFGYRISKLIPEHVHTLVLLARRFDCDVLIDVGANAGQFTDAMLREGMFTLLGLYLLLFISACSCIFELEFSSESMGDRFYDPIGDWLFKMPIFPPLSC